VPTGREPHTSTATPAASTTLWGLRARRRPCACRGREEYYTAAATKAFEKWHRRCDRDGVSAIEERGLAPTSPEPDQEILVSASSLSTQRKLLELVNSLLDSYAHTEELFDAVANAKVLADLDVARELEGRNKDIPNRLASRILATIRQLEQVLPSTLGST